MGSNYYQLLEIPTSADAKTIKLAYRKLAKTFHPDLNPNDPAAEAHFKRINEAYKVLSDPVRRNNYDLFHVIREPKFTTADVKRTFFGSYVKTKDSDPKTSSSKKAHRSVYSNVFVENEKQKPRSVYKLPTISWRKLPFWHYVILSILILLILLLPKADQLIVKASFAFILVYVFVSSLWVESMALSAHKKNSLASLVEISLIHVFAGLVSILLSMPLLFLIWFVVDMIPYF